ncbi:TetR/AcrR family transcriptional regulator [Nocardia panacis]|uniref:TetR/AcrR family transcriptional regulator n=1 Tax=Nocardia panacis TaxID=2340916 RepID=A0A3A4K9C2_9NOCA|nr:TetR/AcrR family transcriptional regulator [Nocardia panacis]RJO69022.1 TetR/AcrR family transcriptional regulator [Nocardia panacis]
MPTASALLQRLFDRGSAKSGGDKSVADGEHLLDSALAAFLDFGVKRTSMGEIARRAGISPATLYRRFDSKNELVEAVTLREARRLVTEIDARARTFDGVAEQLVEIFVAFITALAQNDLLRRLLGTEPDSILPRLTTEAGPILAVGRGYLAEKLSELRAAGGTDDFDADLVAEIMARLALSLALTPDGLIPVEDAAAGRDFARRVLLPMVGVRADA